MVTEAAHRLRGSNPPIQGWPGGEAFLRVARLMQGYRCGGQNMFIALAVLLALAWVLGFTVLKVSSMAIHLLVLFAIISLIAHFIPRGTRAT